MGDGLGQELPVVAEGYGELILLAGRLRDGVVPEVELDSFRAKIEADVDQARGICAPALQASELDNIEYQIIALLDEAAVTHEGSLREFWNTRKLQVLRFGNALAGEHFFSRLDEALESHNPSRLPTLFISYLCLEAGFRGIIAMDAEPEKKLARRKAELKGRLMNVLGPFERIASDPSTDEGLITYRDLPAWAVVVMVLSTLSLVYIVFWFNTRETVNELSNQLVNWLMGVT